MKINVKKTGFFKKKCKNLHLGVIIFRQGYNTIHDFLLR